MMSDELKQVDVRLKLVEGNGVYSDKPITNPEEAISVMADVVMEMAGAKDNFLSQHRRRNRKKI